MPPLPSSLSPHICILSSSDLQELLAAASLPQLSEILQSFSPLPQVTTRTTSLASVPHKAFSLRFSDLPEIEAWCREDEEQRAMRTIDWISSRISSRCAQWIEDIEKLAGKQPAKLPWWEELKRCLEGDHVPSKTETWNHPAAIILAVSTNTPNPLQIISGLHSRAIELPAWVDPAYLRYTLIVHPKDSTLSDEEAGALFNAVKKQYGLHSYLLPLDAPNPPPAPVPVPSTKPRLPLIGSESPEFPSKLSGSSARNSAQSGMNTLRMNEKDIQQTAKFIREFLVMSLIPWMEKCVLDWNENFVSTRRLPSRLFSSTRRLFGTPSPSPTPPPTHRSTPSRASTYNDTSSLVQASVSGGPPQQRRLAEFATILGDFKLAVSVWEALSKEGKGGSDILPLLLSPSPAIPLHVSNALNGTVAQSATPLTQLRALSSAVRWEVGIDSSDFVSELLGGERWLVWAAGSTEESPSALLLAHAAFLSTKKQALRRAALWYLSAASRLEKCGIKPLTMYFLRKAHDLHRDRPKKELSPSFWEAEGIQLPGYPDFDDIMSGIVHPLGRLLYTTGHVKEAVKIFLGLFKGPASSISISTSAEDGPETDEVYLEDFRVAYEHLKSTSNLEQLDDLTLPFTLCLPRQTRLRFSSDVNEGGSLDWDKLEEQWSSFGKSRGLNHQLATESKAYVNELFWIDLALKNPLDVDVAITNLTVKVQEFNGDDTSEPFAEVEVVNNVTIGAKETRIIPISVKPTQSASLIVTHATYNFLSLLPSTESLALRGKRLCDTLAHCQTPTYAPDVLIRVDVAEADYRLLASLGNDRQLILNQGEVMPLRLWLSNAGAKPIEEVWLVGGSDNFWQDKGEEDASDKISDVHMVHSNNSLKPQEPLNFFLGSTSTLSPEDSLEIPLMFHALNLGRTEIHLLLLYRENKDAPWKQVRIVQTCEVLPSFRIASSAKPYLNNEEMFLLDVELQNASNHTLCITQISTVSPSWSCSSSINGNPGPVFPLQSSRFVFSANAWGHSSGCLETLNYAQTKLEDVIRGRAIDLSNPPPLDLCCSQVVQTSKRNSLSSHNVQKFIHNGKRHAVAGSILASHPYIPPHTHPHIFPLYNPAALDVLVFWEITAENRSGTLFISGLNLGATHSPLRDILEAAGNAKIGRNMYVETQREREKILEAVRNSEWNMEMDPVYVTVNAATHLNHDFTKGPCRVRVDFRIRNYSTTRRSRVVLKLNSGLADTHLSFDVQPAVYCGRLTHRAILEPTQYTSFPALVWIGRPGTYALGAWRVETEVLEIGATEHTRHRYSQEPSLEDNPFMTVSHVRGTS